MTNIIHDFSHKITDAMIGLDRDATLYAMATRNNMPAIVCFYAAALAIGEDIVEYENETVQYLLLEQRTSPKIVEKAVMVKALVGNMDGVLTVPEYFKVAADVLCDDDVETGIIDYIEPAKAIWTIVLLMAIFSAENIPVSGDALRYIVACLKSDGWTMPPYLLNIQKFYDFFEYYDPEYYNSIICEENELLSVCGANTDRGMVDAKANFMEMHKPIFQYLHMKLGELQKEIKDLKA
jgi:hypothetical protein